MAEQTIWDELQRNNIEIDKDTLCFHMNSCLKEHEDLFECIAVQISGDNLPYNLHDIYQTMEVVHFGRIIAYLTLVSKVSDSCDAETVRETVGRTVEDFRRVDWVKYKPVKKLSRFKQLTWLFLLTALSLWTL